MHHKPGINLFVNTVLYKRHQLAHHRYYTDEAMAAESPRDYKMVLFPPAIVFISIAVVAGPVMLALHWLVSPNVGYLFCAVAVGYFLSYEWMHLAYHLPHDSRVGRWRLIAALRRHHTVHHDPTKMQRWNFNITFPIADALFRSTWHSDATRQQEAQPEARPEASFRNEATHGRAGGQSN